MDYIDTVRNFVVDNFLFGDGQSLKEDMSFLENGIIDSTGILELITFLEETYNIKIEDGELVPENLDNIQNVVRFIGGKLNQNSVTETENC